ncbi:hypothetical protein NPIL_297691 [Nephila pilipes]|uniref:Uncharacterized protein n=1 Tax=Nephila pilipes TaxID=299642 RepID=A0A8X6I7N0_NEPPI|nr:hypothetical protein NPIL_297691 [Nephila pilipes]
MQKLEILYYFFSPKHDFEGTLSSIPRVTDLRTKFSHGSVTETSETIAFMMPNTDGTNTTYLQPMESRQNAVPFLVQVLLPASRVNYFSCRSMFREEMPSSDGNIFLLQQNAFIESFTGGVIS